jgi:hypothetical protein
VILGIVIGFVIGLAGANPSSELADERLRRRCWENEVHRLEAEAAQRGEVR